LHAPKEVERPMIATVVVAMLLELLAELEAAK
jgi:hypothetical protein